MIHTNLLFLCVVSRCKYGGNRIFPKCRTFARFVNVLLLKVIDAQNRKASRRPVLPLHVQYPFFKFSGVVQGKPACTHRKRFFPLCEK